MAHVRATVDAARIANAHFMAAFPPPPPPAATGAVFQATGSDAMVRVGNRIYTPDEPVAQAVNGMYRKYKAKVLALPESLGHNRTAFEEMVKQGVPTEQAGEYTLKIRFTFKGATMQGEVSTIDVSITAKRGNDVYPVSFVPLRGVPPKKIWMPFT